MKKFILLVLLSLATQLSAQLIVVQTATRQGYAAGACCAYGVDYILVLRVTQPNRGITIDSVKCEGRTFVQPKVEDGSLVITKDATGSTYTIHEALRWTHRLEPNWNDPKPYIQEDPAPPAPEAIVFYHSGGVPHRITIPELTELMPIPYP